MEILEIGSFEGRSALFFLQFLPHSRITCVDTFEGNPEHLDPKSPTATDMSAVEGRFDSNLAAFAGHMTKQKGASIEILNKLQDEGRLFDLIFIDGDHRAAAAYCDSSLAWELLRPRGVMIFDDYKWKPELPITERPKAGIDSFLRSIKGDYLVLHDGYQVIIEKRSTAVKKDSSLHLTVRGNAVPWLTPPLVSFVLVNWNYARYVGQCIDSIIAQDYPHFECIVVDNGSTDDSLEVIERHIKKDTRFKIVKLTKNLGQLGGMFAGIRLSKGPFVVMVDADDVLFPNFASTHLQVHLAAPRSAAITSSNIIEANAEGNPLTSQYSWLRVDQGTTQKGLRDKNTVVRLSTISDDVYLGTLMEKTAVLPREVNSWRWSPGSANMVRRSVLNFFLEDGDNARMRAADSYFFPLCHAFAGSILIDAPLSAYRIHGANYFASQETLDGIRRGDPTTVEGDPYENLVSVLKHVERNYWVLGGQEHFWRIVNQSTRQSYANIRSYYRTPRGVEVFSQVAKEMRKAAGDESYVHNIFARFGYSLSRKIFKKAFGGRIPLKVYWFMLLLQCDYKYRRWLLQS